MSDVHSSQLQFESICFWDIILSHLRNFIAFIWCVIEAKFIPRTSKMLSFCHQIYLEKQMTCINNVNYHKTRCENIRTGNIFETSAKCCLIKLSSWWQRKSYKIEFLLLLLYHYNQSINNLMETDKRLNLNQVWEMCIECACAKIIGFLNFFIPI